MYGEFTKKFICWTINKSKIDKKGDIIKKGKSCGCIVASNVIALEIQRRKKKLELKNLSKKLTKTKNKKAVLNLKRKHQELLNSIREVHKHKKTMKKRFEDYVKNSGYVPPKFKN